MNAPNVNQDIVELLNRLQNAAGQKFEQAVTMPPEIYSSPGLLELEKQSIFMNEWICVGRTAEIPNVGDYLTFEVIDQPVMVIRQKDQSIKAFFNVCLHRCAKLLDDCGNTSRIVCPYHAWTYRPDGQLVGARHMDQTQGFDLAQHRLQEVRHEVWEGFIFISFNDDLAPVADRLAGYADVIGRYQIANYVHAFTYDEVWPANWKCFIENYMDAYHIFKVHKNTFGKYGSSDGMTTLYDGNDHATWHLVDTGEKTAFSENSLFGVAHPSNKHLQGKWRHNIVLGCVFPALTMQLQPDILWYVTVQPQGTDHFRMRWSVSIAPEIMSELEHPEKFIEDTRELLLAVNAEDKGVVGDVYKGTQALGAKQAPMSFLERNLFMFGRYLARQLETVE